MRRRDPHFRIVVVSFAACFASLGCDRSPVDPPKSSTISNSEFEQLRHRYLESIDSSTTEGERESIVEAILDAAGSEPWAEDGDLLWSVIANYANDSLSLDLVDRELKAIDGSDASNKNAFLQRILRELPDSAVGAKALHLQLAALRDTSPAEFLNRCEQAVAKSSSGRLLRVALYNRLQYYRDDNQWKQASLDTLRLWARLSEFVREQGLRTRLVGNLRAAGLLLEADLLDRSAAPDTVAAELLRQFDTETAEASNHGREYFESAPNSTFSRNDRAESIDSMAEAVWYHARVARLALNESDYDSALEHASLAADSADLRYAKPPLNAWSAAVIPEVLDATLWAIVQRFGNETMANIFIKDRNARNDAIRVSRKLCVAAYSLQQRHREGDTKSDDVSLSTAAEYAEALSTLGDHGGVLAFYESLVDNHHNESLSPEIYMLIASYHEVTLNSKHEAAKTYERVHREYPNSPKAVTAFLKEAQMLLDLDRHAACYDLLQQFLLENPANAKVAIAKYMLALCEVNLGFEEQGISHMQQIVEKYGRSAAAPNALFWLGSYHLSYQDYPKAQAVLWDLVTRYPDCRWRKEADSLLVRLEALQTSSQ